MNGLITTQKELSGKYLVTKCQVGEIQKGDVFFCKQAKIFDNFFGDYTIMFSIIYAGKDNRFTLRIMEKHEDSIIDAILNCLAIANNDI